MSVPVEAQSLSTLTNLFANPPQYPRNPTHKVHEPLVLYIVRVPGSKDVFLSPVKPPTKASIGLEAIQSSLYYLHVPTEEDEEVKRAIEIRRTSEEENRPSVSIARKPLPPSLLNGHPLPPIPDESPDPVRSRPYHPSNVGQMPGGNTALRVDTDTHGDVYRKPLGTSSTSQWSSLPRGGGDYAVSSSTQSNQRHEYHDQTERRGYNGLKSFDSPLSQRSPSELNMWNHETVNDFSYGSNSLEIARRTKSQFPPVILIRRDPTSGSQWNIGTITQLEPTFSGSSLHPIAVELQTPGYGRFNRHPETPRPRSAGSDVASIRRAMESATMSPMSTSSDHAVGLFQRVVDYRKMKLSDIKKTAYQNAQRSEYSSDANSSKGNLEKNVLAFTSPWQGTCVFVNGIDGRSFKIKHTISSTSSSAEGLTANVAELRFNLSWSLLGRRHPRKDASEEPDTLPIPKLIESKKENFRKGFQHFREKSRDGFRKGKIHIRSQSDTGTSEDEALRDMSNLEAPRSNNLSRPYMISQTPSYSSSVQTDYEDNEQFHPHLPQHQTSLEDEDRLSLRLGRERAGGGFGGHSAKLGKLIIEDEGLKMCDLVVAAVMGIWWQHYEGK